MKDYTRYAIFLIVGYLLFLTVALYAVQSGLWMAHEATLEIIDAKTQKSKKLPCSSNINENCEVYIK